MKLSMSSVERHYHTIKLGAVAKAVILSALLIYLYLPVVKVMMEDWWKNVEYLHGFLVPLISGYIVWRRRRKLMELPRSLSMSGLLVFSSGLFLYLIGAAGDEGFIQQISIPITLIGLVFFLYGRAVARLVLFPAAYLLLMVPIPYPVYRDISLALRLIDAKIVASVSPFFGVPVFRDGYNLHLPYITLEVADPCSGVFSIVALLAIGLFYINLIRISPAKKILMVIMLIPVAVLSNVIRILTIVVGVYYTGPWLLQTTFHKLNGTFNFLLGLSAIILLGIIFENLSGRENKK